MLNDAAFQEFAEALARRVLKESGPGKVARIEHAFRLCLARAPSRAEKQRLLELLEGELALGAKASKARVPSADNVSDAEPVAKELAAWTTVARVLLNLDETITRE